MKIFGKKPSELRKETIAVLVTLASLLAILATALIGVPQVGAALAVATTGVNAALVALQRKEIAAAIDSADHIFE